MGRGTVNGAGQGLHGDLTTTGAMCMSSLPQATLGGRRGVLRVGDETTPCPQCGKVGVIVEGFEAMKWAGIATALDRAAIHCGCPPGHNRLIAPVEQASHYDLPNCVSPQRAKSFAQSFVITDSHTGRPLHHRTYIAWVDGQRTSGLTDANGLATIQAATTDSVVEIHVMFQAPARELTEFSEGTP
jgi:uncharacterized Zn-binding protein involved in type VI secretion